MTPRGSSILAISVLVVLVVVACYVWAIPPHAGSSSGGVVVHDQVATEDLLTAGRVVRVGAEVQGDLAVAGARVTVPAPVGGYLMSAGRTIRVDGPVGNDIWAAGEAVDVNSHVGNNIRAAGGSVHLHPGTIVGHNARLAGNEVTAEGRVDRDLSIGAAVARIGADVGGTVEVRADRVIVEPGSVIQGDLVVRSPQPPEVSPEANVVGDVRYEALTPGGEWRNRLGWLLFYVAALGLLGLAVVVFAPTWAGRVTGTLAARPGASVLAGLIVVIVTPLVAGLLAITVIGLPLAIVVLALYAVALLFAGVFVSSRLGTMLLGRHAHSDAPAWRGLVLGILIVSLALALPMAGWFVALAIMVMGAGAVVLERRESRPRTT